MTTTGIVEFIMKLTDQASGPLDRLVGRADRAGRSIRDAGTTTEKFSQNTGVASDRINTLISRLQRLQSMRSILPPTAEQDIGRINRLISHTNAELDRMVAGAGGGGRGTMVPGRGLGSLFGSLRGSSALAGIARFGPIGLAIGGAIQSIRMAMPVQHERISWENRFGADGGTLFDQLRRRRVSLGSGAVEAGHQLAESGMSNHAVLSTLRRLGDVANGSETRLSSLASAFSKINRDSRLTEEALSELEANGFNPLIEIHKATGESFESLLKRLRENKITVDEVSASLHRATSEGGEFAGNLDRLNASAKTGLAALTDDFRTAMVNFGESLMEALNLRNYNVGGDPDEPNFADWAAFQSSKMFQDTSLWGQIQAWGPVNAIRSLVGMFGDRDRAARWVGEGETEPVTSNIAEGRRWDPIAKRFVTTEEEYRRRKESEQAQTKMNDRLNAVSGGGIRNITINIAKGIETVNQYFKEGESGRAANELARRFREELVRTLQSVSAR